MNAGSAVSLVFVPLIAVFWALTGAAPAQEDGSGITSREELLIELNRVIAAIPEAQEDGSDLRALDAYRTSSLRPLDGYLVDWSVIGPFSAREENGIGFAVVDVGEVTTVDSVQHAGADYHWSYVITKNGVPVVDLSREFGADAEGIAYALAEVYVNRDMNATIRVETDDEVACWINGQAVTLARAEKDDDGASGSRVRLRLGYNKVVIGLRHGRGKWSFSARVLDEAGEPIDPKRLRILDDGVGFVPAEVHLEIRGRSDTLLEPDRH